MRKDREYRKVMSFELRQAETDSDGLYVEGYALTFDQPTVLYEMDGIEYKEMIDARALKASDMSDVIFNYNHTGKVMARTRNKTLELSVDERGLFVRARLDGTEEGRKLHEEIRGGYIDRMSFSFTVSEQRYDKENRMRVITGIRKLYDVSAVDIPAYDTTSISARSFFEAEAEEERKALDSAAARKKLLLRTFTF
jgi:HK97 family phage prohead protease